MKKLILTIATVLALSVGLTSCKGSNEDAVKEFGIEFGEMVQNKDFSGIKSVYPDAGNITNAHLKFHRDKIAIFEEGDDRYKIRYEDGAYIIVKKGLNDAMEVVKAVGIFDTGGLGDASFQDNANQNEMVNTAPAMSPDEVAPLHKSKKSTPAGLPNYDWLSSSYVNHSDIAHKSGSELRIMRNYIYARHGYKFKSADLRKFFSQYSWYQPRYSDVSSQLSAIEEANVYFIKSYE